MTITAQWDINKYLIDTTVTNGTIDPIDPMVNYGADQTITYSPNTNYHLVSVTVDGTNVTTGNETSYTFTNVTGSSQHQW